MLNFNFSWYNKYSLNSRALINIAIRITVDKLRVNSIRIHDKDIHVAIIIIIIL